MTGGRAGMNRTFMSEVKVPCSSVELPLYAWREPTELCEIRWGIAIHANVV